MHKGKIIVMKEVNGIITDFQIDQDSIRARQRIGNLFTRMTRINPKAATKIKPLKRLF